MFGLRTATVCLFGAVIAGLISGLTARLGQDSFLNTFGPFWFPGLIFGGAFALSTGGSRSDLISFAALCAVIHFGAALGGAFLASSGHLPDMLIFVLVGFLGAAAITAVQFLIFQRALTRNGAAITSIAGAVLGPVFYKLIGLGAGKSHQVRWFVLAYVVWQTPVAAALAVGLKNHPLFRSPTGFSGWRWVIDAIGLVGSIVSIISFFR